MKPNIVCSLLSLVLPILFFTPLVHADNPAPSGPNQHVATRPFAAKLGEELVSQVKMEFNDAEKYLQYTSFFEEKGLYGFVSYLKAHYFIEIYHGFSFYNYIVKRGHHFSIVPVVSASVKFNTPLEIFQSLLADEIQAAGRFEQLVSLARADHDEATVLMMEKFVQVQMDEIYEMGRIVKRLKFAGDNAAAILILDEQLRRETAAHGYFAITGDVDQALAGAGNNSVTTNAVGVQYGSTAGVDSVGAGSKA